MWQRDTVAFHSHTTRPAADGLTDPKLLKVRMQLTAQRREYRLDRATLRYLLNKAGFSKSEQRAYLRGRRPLPMPPDRSSETNETRQDETRLDETGETQNPVRFDLPQTSSDQRDVNISVIVNETNEAQ